MKLFFKLSLIVIFILNLVVFYAESTSFKPKKVENIKPEGKFSIEKAGDTISLTTWNIGYGGLGEESDFFMDGGKTAIPESNAVVEKNLEGIKKYLKKIKSDIVFIQEVDGYSKRSYQINELKIMKKIFKRYNSLFALNFKSPYIPYPFFEPLGKVESGIATFSKIRVKNGVRYQLPGEYGWPEKLFQMKRCILLTKIESVTEKKDWVIINIHLSAFDDGSMRKEEMQFIKRRMVEEYKAGNYVIVGGDWNQMFPEIKKETFAPYTTSEKDLFWVKKMDTSWKPEGWQWVFDKSQATVRSNEKSYRENENFRTTIDGFLISPNVEVVDVKTDDLRFKFSDHNPVTAHFRKNNS